MRRILNRWWSLPPNPPGLPVGTRASTFERMHCSGYDVESALWLADFDTLTETALRQFDVVTKS